LPVHHGNHRHHHPADQPSFTATNLGMEKTIGLRRTVLANASYASGASVVALEACQIKPQAAIEST
jgi:hypothetical protein